MLRHGYVPNIMKRGVIVTLHKGSNKRKDNPDNYRAITLTSVIMKLFETIILNRCKENILQNINMQQGGFQDGLSCLMTSFILRESIYFAREHGSNIYVCFMDGRKAFDTVWHAGLFYKLLNEFKIDATSYTAIRSIYTNMTSCVKYQGLQSECFDVLQGTRQGGKSSPIFYLAYINGLINELRDSGLGMCMYDMKLGSPTVADDMVLISFSLNGLQTMMDICYSYANRWRFQYNADKCSIITFNHSQPDFRVRHLMLGDNPVSEGESYVHLGIKCDSFLQTKNCVAEACNRIRGTFLSICNSGVHPAALNPISSRVLYNSVVLPKSLYGCELWNNISETDILKLERSHRFCIKYMQALHFSVSTDFALAALNIASIETIIDYRKLQFLGQLCRLSNKYLAKNVFNNRLIRFMKFDYCFMGFMPDIYRILQKYHLLEVLHVYLISGTFPSKHVWKRTLVQCVLNTDYQNRILRLLELDNSAILCDLLKPNNPCVLWQIARGTSNVTSLCKTLVSLVGRLYSLNFIQLCPKCSSSTDNIVVHLINFCHINENQRQSMLKRFMSEFGWPMFIKLMSENPRHQCITLIKCAIISNNNIFVNFWLLKYLNNMVS